MRSWAVCTVALAALALPGWGAWSAPRKPAPKTAAASAPAPAPRPGQAVGILTRRCFTCHSHDKKSAGIDLSTPLGVKAAGAHLPENRGNRVLAAVLSGRMPPTGKLPAEEMAILRAWARAGAPFPADPQAALWSLKPVANPRPPAGRFTKLSANPVDAFVFQKLEAMGLRPSPLASRPELLRRVTVDLTGLPPTPEEMDAFLADRAPGAYERVVDRLLASTAYGERWGRHWLDVGRYGDSHGYEPNHLRPNAWPYRDWVISALNRDMPYARFVQAQLAGDGMTPEQPLDLAATGFLVAGVHDVVGNQAEEGRRQQRANDLDDMVATTSEAFLGLTVGCARCHDHKFDPVPQADYYRLSAVFAGVQHAERPLAPADDQVPANRRVETFPAQDARYLRLVITATDDGSEPCIDELEIYNEAGINVALASAGARATASSLLPGYPIHQVAHLNDGKLGNDHSWISNEKGAGWAQIELPRVEKVRKVIWSRDAGTPGRFRDRQVRGYRLEVSADGRTWRQVAARAADAGEEVRPGMPVYAGSFTAPHPTYLLKRGDVMQRGDTVLPGALTRIPGPRLNLKEEDGDLARRRALADWITDPRNPLTYRVMVNRLWQGHFGRGLVNTPSDFGHNGDTPSHPELLDYLARRLAHGQISLKGLHRLMVTSYTYRQSAVEHAQGRARDAGNRYLWRMPLRRMEGEAIRDAMLAVSGKLDRRMGGPGFRLFKYRVVNVAIYEPLTEFGPETWRRSIYRQAARSIREELLGTFDTPESAQRAPRREVTTTALQSLSLLNGAFTQQQAGFLAQRVEAMAGNQPESQARAAFRLAFARQASPEEVRGAAALIREHGLPNLCRALFNASEFLYY